MLSPNSSDKSNINNIIITAIASILIVVGWQYFYEIPKQNKLQQIKADNQQAVTTTHQNNIPTILDNGILEESLNEALLTHEQSTFKTNKNNMISFKNDHISGYINNRGLKIENLLLLNYHKTPTNKENIVLFSPSHSLATHYVMPGWAGFNAKNSFDLPDSNTIWETSGNSFIINEPILFIWSNKTGHKFHIEITLDNNYLFKIRQWVENGKGAALQAIPYVKMRKLLTKQLTSESSGHEGPIGYINNTFEEIGYKKVMKKNFHNFYLEKNSYRNWVGLGEKYWLTSLMPDNSFASEASFKSQSVNGNNYIQLNIAYPPMESSSIGQTPITETLIFAGAKEIDVLDAYAKRYNIKAFDKAIDFGLFYFLTKPLLLVIKKINIFVHNYGFSIILLTILIRIILLPLANKSYISIVKMKKVQPRVKALKESYKGDREGFNKAIVQLYRTEKINPLSQIIPILIQIPVFFALYKVLYSSLELRHSSFLGWIHDLSEPEGTSLFNLFGLIPLALPKFMNIGLLPILMGLSMWLQQALTPMTNQYTDANQTKIIKFLPLIFTFLFANFPSGLMIYWIVSNVFSALQQFILMKSNKS